MSLSQLKSTSSRKQAMFRIPVEVLSYIQEWSQKERKSQTRIVVETLEAEKQRRDQNKKSMNPDDMTGTPHIWINGPDGHGYHCPICGISRCNDHDGYRTCEEWIIHQAEILKHRTDPLFDVSRRLWKEYLNGRTL